MRRSPLFLAWKQLSRDKVRLLVALAGVSFAVLLMLMQLGFRSALFQSSVRVHEILNSDVFLISPLTPFIGQARPFPRRRLDQALGAPGVSAVSGVYAAPGFWMDPTTGANRNIFMLGFDPSDPAILLPEVMGQVDKLKQKDQALFDRGSRPEFGPVAARVARGESVVPQVNDHRISIVGLFTMGTCFGVDGTLLTSDLNFLRLNPGRPPGNVEIGLVRVEPGAAPSAVKRRLEAALPRDVLVLTRAEYEAREISYWNASTPIGYVFAFGVLIGFGVGAVIVSQILFADVTDHIGEYATLKAMGYRGRYLYGVVLYESLLLAAMGYLPGVLGAAVCYRLAERATMLPMRVEAPVVLLVLALTFTMCAGSGLLALRKVQRTDPAEMFA